MLNNLNNGIVPPTGVSSVNTSHNTKSIATVATPSASYDLMAEKWDLPQTLWGGTPAMRAAGTKYLPQEPKESDTAYKNRLNRSFLINLYKRTLQTVTGLAFLKPVVVSGVPDELKDIEYNVDGNGRSITEIAFDMTLSSVHLGLSHLYVDLPDVDTSEMSLKDFREANILPYAALVHPTRVIGWRTKQGTGKPTLQQVRVLEDKVEESDLSPWEDKLVQYVRVIYQDKMDIYRLDPELDSDWTLAETVPTDLGYIPLLTAYSNKTGTMVAEPPLLDLAYANLAHYVSSSDQRNILHVSRVPFLLATGFDEGELDSLEIGSNRMIVSSSETANIKHVEHSGSAINAGRNDIKDLEAHCGLLGADLLLSKSVSRQTATARQLDQSESMSTLQMTLRSVEQVLEQMYQIMGELIGVDASNVSVSIGDDLSIAREPNPTAALRILQDMGLLTDEQLLDEAKRQGILSSYMKLDPDRPNAQEGWGEEGDSSEPTEEQESDEDDEEESDEETPLVST